MALDALGALPADERPGLLAHLDGCASCRDVAHELHATASALALVDDAALAPTASVPPALAERVLGGLHRDARSARRQRVARVAGAAAIGAIAASVLAFVALASSPAVPRTRTETLHGRGATATAVLAGEPWGTSIEFSEEGQPAGRIYEVSMRTASGTWWQTGSYTAIAGGGIVAPTMSCAVPMDRITGIRVTDASGRTVLQTVARTGTSW